MTLILQHSLVSRIVCLVKTRLVLILYARFLQIGAGTTFRSRGLQGNNQLSLENLAAAQQT